MHYSPQLDEYRKKMRGKENKRNNNNIASINPVRMSLMEAREREGSLLGYSFTFFSSSLIVGKDPLNILN